MWYVKGNVNGITAWWGAYQEKKTAEELAQRINGKVYHESELEKLR